MSRDNPVFNRRRAVKWVALAIGKTSKRFGATKLLRECSGSPLAQVGFIGDCQLPTTYRIKRGRLQPQHGVSQA